MTVKVEMYTSANCAYCMAAKNLIKRKGLDYEEIRIDTRRRHTTRHIRRKIAVRRFGQFCDDFWLAQDSLSHVVPSSKYCGKSRCY